MKKDGGEHFVVTSNVIAPDEYNYDWTSVRYGNSYSSAESGDTCFIDPIRPGINSEILAGDIVFASVQPNDRHYVHLVWRIETWYNEYGVKRTVYVIGNNYKDNRQRCNGWCYREHIYGILTKTQRCKVRPVREEIHECT